MEIVVGYRDVLSRHHSRSWDAVRRDALMGTDGLAIKDWDEKRFPSPPIDANEFALRDIVIPSMGHVGGLFKQNW